MRAICLTKAQRQNVFQPLQVPLFQVMAMFHPCELLQWIEMRLNHPHYSVQPDTAIWPLFAEDGERLSRAPRSITLRATSSLELLIVLTTYRRPEPCTRVLTSLPRALELSPANGNFHTLVIEDRSDMDYAPVRAAAEQQFTPSLTWLCSQTHLGKRGFWKSYAAAFSAARILKPRHTLFIQDDVEFGPTMLRRTYELWEATENDTRRRVLYLLSLDDDNPCGQWIYFRRRPTAVGLRLTQWFDLAAYFVDHKFFELLKYKMIPIHPNRWRRRPTVSSGVGRQLTQRLFRRGSVYQADPSLVAHGGCPSEMNPSGRKYRPLDNRKHFENQWSSSAAGLSILEPGAERSSVAKS